MLIYTITFSVIFKQIEIMVIALLSFRPIKNIMNLTISNQANTYFNLSTPSKLIVDVTYIYEWFKKMTLNKTNKKLKKYVYFEYFELQLICFIKPTPIHKHNLWNKFSPLWHYHFLFFLNYQDKRDDTKHNSLWT